MNLILGFDGGNAQDLACYGWTLQLCDEHKHMTIGEGYGKCWDELQTNNVAEWSALLYGLMAAIPAVVTLTRIYQIDKLYLHGDSQLVLRQLTGEYSTNKPHLKFYLKRAQAAVARIEQEGVTVVTDWEGRDNNEGPDKLTHLARKKYMNWKLL
jgi:ribonuclease HI